MTDPRDRGLDPERRLRRPLALTRLGMTAERLARAFWPAWTVALLALAALMMGAHEALAVEAVWALGLAAGLGLAAALGWGGWRFRMPSRAEARERLDATLPGRPIAALADRDAVGGHDPASRAIWAAHQSRMARLAARARAVPADLRLADRDPYALRYAALTALAVAVLFGSLLRAASVTDALPGAPGAAMASGPAWEGWVEPPAYTGRALALPRRPARGGDRGAGGLAPDAAPLRRGRAARGRGDGLGPRRARRRHRPPAELRGRPLGPPRRGGGPAARPGR